jgi:hypothetical protein
VSSERTNRLLRCCFEIVAPDGRIARQKGYSGVVSILDPYINYPRMTRWVARSGDRVSAP